MRALWAASRACRSSSLGSSAAALTAQALLPHTPHGLAVAPSRSSCGPFPASQPARLKLLTFRRGASFSSSAGSTGRDVAMHASGGTLESTQPPPSPPPLTGPPGQQEGGSLSGAPAPADPQVRIAVGQMTATGDQAANLAVCSQLARDAAAAGCRMLFLPECFAFIGESQPQSIAAAQPLNGPLMTQYCQLARSEGLWLSLGGFQEVGPDPAHIYNTHVVVDDSGELVAAYRKIHLFDVDVPNGPVLMESRTTAPGSEVVVVDTPAGRLGLTTCYDLRFPELFAHLTWERGTQILAVPSAFTVVTGAAHWEVLLRARAIECQSYVVAAAQAGRHNAKRESYGHAIVVDPWGTVVAALADPSATGIAVAEVALGPHGLLARTRERMPCQLHRAKGRTAYAPEAAAAAASQQQ